MTPLITNKRKCRARIVNTLSELLAHTWWNKNSKPCCQEWAGSYSVNGCGKKYGRCNYNGVNSYTHRVAWELANNKPPGKQQVHHTCQNTLCCNPEHLVLQEASKHTAWHNRRRAKTKQELKSKLEALDQLAKGTP